MVRVRMLVLSAVAVALAACSDNGDPTQPPPPSKHKVKTIGASKDNTLYEDAGGAWSNGSGQRMFVGKTRGPGGGIPTEPAELRRALIAFDVANNIPSGSTIDSVSLTLNMSKTHATAGPQLIGLHKVSQDWGEGTSIALGEEGGGADAEPNDATWIHTFYDTDSWANPGGDFVLGPSASRIVDDLGKYTWGSTAQMTADVQGWLVTPTSNFGWILVNADETPITTAKRFDARENATASNRPALKIHYTEP